MRVTGNDRIARDIFRMRTEGDTSGIFRPGQFVNLLLEGFFLRRPISVCDWTDGQLTLIYKTVGKGTEQLSRIRPGTEIDMLTGLGNGYSPERAGDHPLIIGGGVGVPPLYGLARRLQAEGKQVTAVLGFNTREDVFYESEFRDLGCSTVITTADGSHGRKGFVTDHLPPEYSYFYACGPIPMLKAVYRTCPAGGEFSLEERMGCGFGACMGCSIETKAGAKRVCREGPVFEKEALAWNE